jgi:hypothetical protein
MHTLTHTHAAHTHTAHTHIMHTHNTYTHRHTHSHIHTYTYSLTHSTHTHVHIHTEGQISHIHQVTACFLTGSSSYSQPTQPTAGQNTLHTRWLSEPSSPAPFQEISLRSRTLATSSHPRGKSLLWLQQGPIFTDNPKTHITHREA